MVTADFLSPKISRLHELDPCLDHYAIETKDPKKLFGQFMSNDFAVDVAESDRDAYSFFNLLAQELQNQEMFLQIVDLFCKQLDNDNVCDVLQGKQELHLDCSLELEYLAQHFESIHESAISTFNLDQLYQILSRPDFRISNEDFLYALVSRLFRKDSKYFSLLEFVHFEYLSSEKINEFVDDSFEFLPEINAGIWRKIAARLRSRAAQSAPVRSSSEPSVAKPPPKDFQIFIKTLQGQTLVAVVKPEMSVDELKRLIAERTGVQAERQRLSAQGRLMESGRKLSDCGLRRDSTVHVSLRL